MDDEKPPPEHEPQVRRRTPLEEKVVRYQRARIACELARELLRELPLEELLSQIDRADTIGPMLDPTLWIGKGPAMREDRAVFAAALRFLGTWPK